MALLQVDNLSVELPFSGGWFTALDKFSLRVEEGSYHGIIGESGSGKSLAMSAIMGLLSSNARVKADRIALNGEDISSMSHAERRATLYQDVSIIFQEPKNSLNPCYKIKQQIHETLYVHGYDDSNKCADRCKQLLLDVGINDIDTILNSYPHQLTAPVLQRIMIAIALASEPRVLIADEPTTELAPTEANQIMQLLNELVRERHMAMILISHDLELLREKADYISIMYCSQVVEAGTKDIIFNRARHPYTLSILAGIPVNWSFKPKTHVPVLKGSKPSPYHLPVGCYLGPRCAYADAKCVQSPLPKFDENHMIRCHFPVGVAIDD